MATFDKKRSLLNVSIAIGTKIVLLLMSFLVRRCLIIYGGASLGGLAALFGDIVGILAIVECGIDGAILYHLYQPIVAGDTQQVAALYRLCRKAYLIIDGVIVGLGLLVTPFLPLIIEVAGDFAADVNVYLTFWLFLATTCVGYFFRAKVVLIDAHKNNFVVTSLQAVSVLVGQILQIVALVVWHSFTWYLVGAIVNALVNWLLLTIYTRRHYRSLITTKAKLDPATGQAVKRSTKAMLAHYISGVISTYIDNLIILLLIGFVTRNAYANYILILESLSKLLQLFLSPLTAIIGHHCVQADANEKHRYFQFFYTVNLVINLIFMLGYFAVINPLITIWFGSTAVVNEGLALNTAVVALLVINNFTIFLSSPLDIYRNATGSFYYDRWVAVGGTLFSLISMPLLTWWLGIMGTLLSALLKMCLIVGIFTPLIIYPRVFARRPTKFYLVNYGLVAVFAAAVGVVYLLLTYVVPVFASAWLQFLVNGWVAVAVAGVVLLLLLAVSPTFRDNVRRGLRVLRSRRKAVAQ